MNCQTCREQMAEILDSVDSVGSRQAIAQHLGECTACASEAEAMRAMHLKLVAAADGAPTSDLSRQVMLELNRHDSAHRHYRRTRWTLATAASVLIALLIFAMFFSFGERMTLADVRSALASQTWMHVRYDAGQIKEQWSNPSDGKSYAMRFDGDAVYIDDKTNRRRWYSTREGTISEDVPTIYPNGKQPEWKPSTIADQWAGIFDRMTKDPSSYERHDETIDGKKLVRFDYYNTDSLGKRILFEQIWVDSRTHLPVKDRNRLQLAERNEWGKEWKSGEYDFPPSGPQSLYELGVPTTVPVISRMRADFPANVKQIIDSVTTERAKFPQRYRAVCWEDSPNGMIDVIYQDGKKLRQERYFNLADGLAEDPSTSKPLGAPLSTAKILAWARTQTPVEINLIDGERQYTRMNQPAAPTTQPTVHVMRLRGDFDLLPKDNRPCEMSWPFWNHSGPAALLGKTDDAPAGSIGVRFGGEGNYRWDYFVDPQKGFVCIKQIGWDKHDGRWAKMVESELTDLHLIGGQWCPGKSVRRSFPITEHILAPSETTWTIATDLLEESDLPPHAFDGQLLLQGASVEGY